MIMHAGGTNVCPPDEDDVAQVFSHLRPMCNPKVVCNWDFHWNLYSFSYSYQRVLLKVEIMKLQLTIDLAH